MAANPHNVVRLILPRLRQGTEDQYREAARRPREWQDEQICAPTLSLLLDVYEQALIPGRPARRLAAAAGPAVGAAQVIQRGLIGALRLEPIDAGIVLPHEGVAPGPVIGRRQLMEATQANLEPIFLIYGADSDSAAASATRLLPPGSCSPRRSTSASGCAPNWAITDPAEVAAIAADRAGPPGHRRRASPRPRLSGTAAAAARRGRRARAVGLRAAMPSMPGLIPGRGGHSPGHPQEPPGRRGGAGPGRRSGSRSCRRVRLPAAVQALTQASRDGVAFLAAGELPDVPADRP